MPRIGQRADRGNPQLHADATMMSNEQLEKALLDGELDVAADTTWLWARAGMTDSADTLFVDEAGQLSLANVLAVAGAARNLVLLGDPQQLAQPRHATPPPGAGAPSLPTRRSSGRPRSRPPGGATPPTRRARAPPRSSTSWATGRRCPRALGCCSRPGIPLRPAPAERRDLTRPGPGHHRGRPGPDPGVLPDPAPYGPGERAVPGLGNGRLRRLPLGEGRLGRPTPGSCRATPTCLLVASRRAGTGSVLVRLPGNRHRYCAYAPASLTMLRATA